MTTFLLLLATLDEIGVNQIVYDYWFLNLLLMFHKLILYVLFNHITDKCPRIFIIWFLLLFLFLSLDIICLLILVI